MKKERLIYTLDSCVGCNKCIKFCPALGVNRSVKGENGNRIEVDGSKCIHCGNCIKTCEHDARAYLDDWEAVLRGLENGEKIVLMIAPSFFMNYSSDWQYYVAFLREMGFVGIYNVSFGADITTWVSVKYIKTTGRRGLISSACPAVVDYIEKYKPSLISRLMPVMSPVGALQTYLRDRVYNGDDVKYAFLCPCIGKHDEYTTYPDGHLVDYNITIKTFLNYIRDKSIDIRSYGRGKCDELGNPGAGITYPVPSGFKNNIRQYMGYNTFVKQVEGPGRLYPYFDIFERMLKNGDTLPLLVDALNCEGGCIEGVASDQTTEDAEVLMCRVDVAVTDILGAPPSMDENNEKISDNWLALDDYMSTGMNLDYRDFMRKYNEYAVIYEGEVPEEAINEIFLQMNKKTETDRKVNCTSCGYKGCREMARAIYLGFNKPENCVHYVNSELENNKKQLEEVLVALSGGMDRQGAAFVKSEQIVQTIKDSILEVENEREILNNSLHTRNRMFANLTHELRTPLNAVMNMASLMDRDGLTPEQLENIEAIEVAGKGLLDTINEMLDFSKIEAGQLNIVEEQYCLHELLGEIITVMTFRCMEKKLELIRELDDTTPNILMGDFKRIRQIAINMIGNAVKYTKEGCVIISCGWNHDPENMALEFMVKDTGIGIKEEDLPYIFESYKQVDESSNRHIVGTGLGLSIVKSLLDAMGGTVRVESEYNVGTTFYIEIPQKVVENVPIRNYVHKNNAGEENDGRKEVFRMPFLKALVVDDMSINLHIARTFLDRYQIFAETAESGAEAVEKCLKTKYDLIFMDHLMPGMDGNEAVRAIKTSNGLNTDTPIISMSAEGSENIKTGPGELFMAIISKPIQKKQLESVLKMSAPADKVLYDDKGFIPMASELRAVVENKDNHGFLVLIAGLEVYADRAKEDRVYKMARKYRLMVQQGFSDIPFSNVEAIIAQCNILRS